ncbi:hypothetical protein KI387_024881, partial [Taxus chinensis]
IERSQNCMHCDRHRITFPGTLSSRKGKKDMVLEALNSSSHVFLGSPEEGGFYHPEGTGGLAFFQMLEGISNNTCSFADDMEEKLAALEQLEKQHKPWQHSFQQLLNFPLSHDESVFGIHGNNQLLYAPQNMNVLGQMQQQQQQQQLFELESCITHVSDLKTEVKDQSGSEAVEEGVSSSTIHEPNSCVTVNSSSENCTGGAFVKSPELATKPAQFVGTRMEGRDRRKRKRSKTCKNSEEVESQRMTHIAVERNRRKQMNEHLAVLRSLMPGSYIQRGDQASIIGGAIDFVKELEQLLQSLQAQKRRRESEELGYSPNSPIPFNGFFQSPQYTSYSAQWKNSNDSFNDVTSDLTAENKSAVADIEVTMIETHASLKILSQKRPAQLLKTIAALQSLRMTILHLNITTVDQTVLYSFNVKIEDECQLTSADEIATAVHQIFSIIHSNILN